MTDEQTQQPAPEPEVVMHKQVFPEGRAFPQELLEQWVAIPSEEPLIIGPLSRGSLDQFLFAITDISGAIAELRFALIAYSNGKIDRADKHLINSTLLLADGETRNRLLFESIMRSAIEVRQNAGK